MAEIAGLIAEFSPFHQGHQHILEEIRNDHPDLLVCIISGYFTQRGLPSLLTPLEKTKKALEYGVDLVLELPSLYTLQSAFFFARAAIESLAAAGVTVLYAGSESRDQKRLEYIADSMHDLVPDPASSLLHSLEKEYGRVESNDLLALCYLYWARRHQMKVRLIQRDPRFESATSIRERFFKGQALDYEYLKPLDFSSFYPWLRYLLLLEAPERLKESFLMEEGLEYRLKQAARENETGEEFLRSCLSKTYTKGRIRRVCLQLLLQNDKEFARKHASFSAVIPLGLNEKARSYLKAHPLADFYPRKRDLPQDLKTLREKACLLYGLALDQEIEESFPVIWNSEKERA